MAGTPTFEHWEEGDVHSYRLIQHEGPFVERVSPAPDDEVLYEEKLYLGVVWHLAGDRRLYMVPRFHRETGFVNAGEPYALIRWEYEVEDDDFGEAGAIRGFVPARSSVRIFPPPGPWEKEHGHLAGMFEASQEEQLVKTFYGLNCDATAGMNIYALENFERAEKVAGVLMGSSRPDVRELLGPADFIAHFGSAIDWTLAVLVLHSRQDLGDELSQIFAAQLRARREVRRRRGAGEVT